MWLQSISSPGPPATEVGLLVLSDGGPTFNFAGLCWYKCHIGKWLGKVMALPQLQAAEMALVEGIVRLLCGRRAAEIHKSTLSGSSAADGFHVTKAVGLQHYDVRMVVEALCLSITRRIGWTLHKTERYELMNTTDWVGMVLLSMERSIETYMNLDVWTLVRALVTKLPEFSEAELWREVRKRVRMDLSLAINATGVWRRPWETNQSRRWTSPWDGILDDERLRFNADVKSK